MKETIVIKVMPVWAPIRVVHALTGLPVNKIRALTNEGKIRARKLGASDTSACLFRVQDAVDAIEEEYPAPATFKLPANNKDQL